MYYVTQCGKYEMDAVFLWTTDVVSPFRTRSHSIVS